MHHRHTRNTHVARAIPDMKPLAFALTLVFASTMNPAGATSATGTGPASPLPGAAAATFDHRDTRRTRGGILRFVTNCNDAGAGSLRAVAAQALPGDGIDLSALTCSQISVTTGAITLRDVDLIGPGADQLTINGLGNQNRRIFSHNSQGGELRIDGVTISGGKYLSNAGQGGGCLRSNGGVVSIRDSVISNCMVITPVGASGSARGGAIAAYGSGVTLLDTTITGSTARTDHASALGGAVFATGNLHLRNSAIRNNSVSASGEGATMLGGGLYAPDAVWIYDSTIDGNTSGGHGGGVVARISGVLERATVSNNFAVGGASGVAVLGVNGGTTNIHTSTLSGNVSEAFEIGRSGAIYTNSPFVSIVGSTITDNHETTLRATGEGRGAGITFGANTVNVSLSRTIASGNCFQNEVTACFASDINGPSSPSFAIGGQWNLVGWSGRPLPGDTHWDPLIRLGPLQDNGGPTWTHLPLAGSPAIDRGDPNAVGIDQRHYPRRVGAAADIGSVETNDVIFADGFE